MFCQRAGKHAVNASLDELSHEWRCRLEHIEQVEVAGHIYAHLLSVTNYVSLACSSHLAEHVCTEFLEFALVGSYQNVAILESESFRLLVELHAERHVLRLNIVVAPCEKTHCIEEQCKQEVDQYATNHNQQTLPCRLRTELPRLSWLLHLIGIERFVDHTRYLAVAAQRQPAYTICSVALARLELEEVKPRVEEQEEFLNSYTEEL